MLVKDFIIDKREGKSHSPAELEAFLSGYLSGEVKDYQAAAWLMAVFFRGMTREETREWTRLMWKSGVTLPRRHRRDYWIDKHSTGGVGDKTSLILVPWVAATCRRLFGEGAVRLPMVSGRGLGHTGGTLDKLEAVPGFTPRIPLERAMTLLENNGFFMMGQTEDMAPADRLLYALRDVTGTVESLPLIVSSILSKKLSENLDGLVMDVKVGRGAFMKTPEEARRLAEGLLDGARSRGVAAVALLTDMDEPLGRCVGHHLEVEECADFLAGEGAEPRLLEVTAALASWMVALASRGRLSAEQAREELGRDLETGKPLELFRLMFTAQGGDYAAFERERERLAPRYARAEICAPRAGWITEVDALAVGKLVAELGGGRNRKEDELDHRVGLELLKRKGDRVDAGDPVAVVIRRTDGPAFDGAGAFRAMMTLGDERPETALSIKEVIRE